VLLALLAGSGLRIGEALALRWRDVDLGTGTLYVRDAKTPKAFGRFT
jgi:integrase